MKRKRLFFIALALLTGMGAKADVATWSDVTGTYLKNPGFEDATAATATVTFQGSQSSGRFLWSPKDWTAAVTGSGTNTATALQETEGDYKNGIWAGYLNAFKPTDGTPTGTSYGSKSYLMRIAGNDANVSAITLTQSVTLPAGIYRVKADLAAAYYSSSTQTSNVDIFVKLGETTIANYNTGTVDKLSSDIGASTTASTYASKWSTRTTSYFTLTTETTVTIGAKFNKTGGNLFAGIDNFVLEQRTNNIGMIASLNSATQASPVEISDTYIDNPECSSNGNWPGSGRMVRDEENAKYHWSGNRAHFYSNHQGVNRYQQVIFPKAGLYLLKTAVRIPEAKVNDGNTDGYVITRIGTSSAASDADAYVRSNYNSAIGASGGTIATDGTEWPSVAAGIAADKSFANENKGYGWFYQRLYFYIPADNTSRYILQQPSYASYIGGMNLYYLGAGDAYQLTTSDVLYNDVNFSKASYAYNIAAGSYGTLCLPFDFTVPTGLTAYTLSAVDGNKVYGNEVDGTVSAGTAVLLRNQGGSAVSGTLESTSAVTVDYTNAAVSSTDNLLVGVYAPSTASTAGNYLLQNGGEGVAFYLVDESDKPTVPPYRAYLQPTSGGSAKALRFVFGDEANAIETALAGSTDAQIEAVYTLSGTRLAAPQRGINIVKFSNGQTQKIVIK